MLSVRALPTVPHAAEAKSTTSIFKDAVSKMRGVQRKVSVNSLQNNEVLPQTPNKTKPTKFSGIFGILGGQDQMGDSVRNDGELSPNGLLSLDVSEDGSPSTLSKLRLNDGAHYTTPKELCDPRKIEQICEMGFSQADAEQALNIANGELQGALELLISSEQQRQKTSHPLSQDHHSRSKPSSAVPGSAAGRENFGPVPVLCPTRTPSMPKSSIQSGEKKDIISDLDPDKVLLNIYLSAYCCYSAIATTLIICADRLI